MAGGAVGIRHLDTTSVLGRVARIDAAVTIDAPRVGTTGNIFWKSSSFAAGLGECRRRLSAVPKREDRHGRRLEAKASQGG